MSAPLILPRRAENESQFARLHAQCFEDPWNASFFANLFGSPGVLGWLVGRGQDVEGFLVLRIVADECEILTIGTVPEAQRHGLARSLLVHGAREAFAHGARTIFLEVAENNAAARALYTQLGFAAMGRRAGYYRDKNGAVDALTWRAALPLLG